MRALLPRDAVLPELIHAAEEPREDHGGGAHANHCDDGDAKFLLEPRIILRPQQCLDAETSREHDPQKCRAHRACDGVEHWRRKDDGQNGVLCDDASDELAEFPTTGDEATARFVNATLEAVNGPRIQIPSSAG